MGKCSQSVPLFQRFLLKKVGHIGVTHCNKFRGPSALKRTLILFLLKTKHYKITWFGLFLTITDVFWSWRIYIAFVQKLQLVIKKINTRTSQYGYASVRPFLFFHRSNSNSLLRPFVKSRLLIGREVQVEVEFWSK